MQRSSQIRAESMPCWSSIFAGVFVESVFEFESCFFLLLAAWCIWDNISWRAFASWGIVDADIGARSPVGRAKVYIGL